MVCLGKGTGDMGEQVTFHSVWGVIRGEIFLGEITGD